MHLLTSVFSEKTLISKTLHKDQLMLLLTASRVFVSRKFRASSPGEKDGLSPVFPRDTPSQSQFFCTDSSGSADHFLFPQNNCAYSPCVNLTPLICAIYLTILYYFMFSQYIFVLLHILFAF